MKRGREGRKERGKKEKLQKEVTDSKMAATPLRR